MAQQHLDDIEKALIQRGWEVTDLEETPGADDWGIAGRWEIARGEQRLRIAFDGRHADGLITYPLEQAYACHVQEDPSVGIYFGKRSPASAWRSELDGFVAALDALKRD